MWRTPAPPALSDCFNFIFSLTQRVRRSGGLRREAASALNTERANCALTSRKFLAFLRSQYFWFAFYPSSINTMHGDQATNQKIDAPLAAMTTCARKFLFATRIAHRSALHVRNARRPIARSPSKAPSHDQGQARTDRHSACFDIFDINSIRFGAQPALAAKGLFDLFLPIRDY